MTKDARTNGSHCSPCLSLTWLNLAPSPRKQKEVNSETKEPLTEPRNPKHHGTQTMLKTLSGNQTLKLVFLVFWFVFLFDQTHIFLLPPVSPSGNAQLVPDGVK